MRNIHNYVQFAASLMFAGSAWGLTHNIYWGVFVMGMMLMSWSVLAELHTPAKRKRTETDLRSVA